jgi:hypothetical protein
MRWTLRVISAMWTCVVLLWATEIWACTCTQPFSLVSEERLSRALLEPIDDPILLDPSQPIVMLISRYLDTPIVYEGKQSLGYSLQRISYDSLCGADLVALTLEESPRPGSTLEIVSPLLRARAAAEESRGSTADWYSPIQVHFGSRNTLTDTSVNVFVTWKRSWPSEFGSCDSNALLEHQSHGSATVLVTSNDAVEFFATSRVVLRSGESYQVNDFSHWKTSFENGRPHELSGSFLSHQIPLTHPGDSPECVEVTVYDSWFQVIFRESLCARTPYYEDPSQFKSFDARLAPLPPMPLEEGNLAPSDECHLTPLEEGTVTSRHGCSFQEGAAPLQPSWFIVAMATLLLAHRRRPSENERGRHHPRPG